MPKVIFYILSFLEINLRFFIIGIKLKPKVVHCHDTLVLATGYILSKLFGSFLVYDAHELNFMRSSPSFVNRFNKILESFVWSRINLFISVSQGIIDFYKFYYGEKDALLVPNCNEYHFNRESAFKGQNLKKLYNIPSDTPLFIFIGAFIKARGIENILKAFSDSCVKSHVVFIGYGELKNKVIEYESCGNIHHHGPLKPDVLVDCASSGDFGLCLLEPNSYSDYLSMPNKFYDYLNSNLKIICSGLPEIQAATLKYELGFVIDGNIQSIIDLVKKIEIEYQSINNRPVNIPEAFNWTYHSQKLSSKYDQFFTK